MVWVKKITIFQLFFLGNIGQKNVFYDILERRNAFLGYKNKKFKSRKINIFARGLTFVFGPKMAIFPTFFFEAIYIVQENVFYDILEPKKRLCRLQKQEIQKVKKVTFFQTG